MQKNNLYIGWDIGGAHTKYSLTFKNNKKYECGIISNELWKSAISLESLINEIYSKYKKRFNIINAITMSGEMSDIYRNRKEGVSKILSLFKRQSFTNYVYTSDKGLVPFDSSYPSSVVASANWHVISNYLSNYTQNTIAVDMGSTTTDIILIRNNRCINKRKDDFTGLQALELLYTGALRTPIYSVAQSLSIGTKNYHIIPENFATMSDVYRILSIIPIKSDYSLTADGKLKTKKESFIRLARIFGFDYTHDKKNLLIKLSKNIHSVHLEKISYIIKSHIIKNFNNINNLKIIGMGVGQNLVKSVAKMNQSSYVSLNDFINLIYKKGSINPSDLAPSYLLSCLLKKYHE